MEEKKLAKNFAATVVAAVRGAAKKGKKADGTIMIGLLPLTEEADSFTRDESYMSPEDVWNYFAFPLISEKGSAEEIEELSNEVADAFTYLHNTINGVDFIGGTRIGYVTTSGISSGMKVFGADRKPVLEVFIFITGHDDRARALVAFAQGAATAWFKTNSLGF